MASYESYGGNFILPHPYKVTNVTGYGVALDGNRETIKKLVDRTLNPLGNQAPRYHLVSSTVLFTFMRMGCMQCAAQPQGGSFSERELNVTLLVARRDKLLIRFFWYMPYLWLDSGPALIAGRDIYGFPKQIAEVTIPDLGQLGKFSATAEVLHENDGQPAERKEILSARRVPAGILQHGSVATNVVGGLEILGTFLTFDPDAVAELGIGVPFLDPNRFSMVFMRQLPSIANFTKACFRSVAEAGFTVTFRSAGLLDGEYEVSIPYHHSVRLAHELGIALDPIIPGSPGKDVTLPAKAVYHMDFDFILGAGQDLWVEYEP